MKANQAAYIIIIFHQHDRGWKARAVKH